MNYYNDNDPKVCAWLGELIAVGAIPPGHIDNRSICDVQPGDLDCYTQCHFFAGIGGWSLALKLAGWSPDRPVWTGSCPCQPFSVAGSNLGRADPRHLWPIFRNLVGQCRPSTVIGEQVASAAGREWLAGVRADLEALAYAVGAADLCAAGIGAPHIRQRLYWVANANSGQRDGITNGQGRERHGPPTGREQGDGQLECGGETSRLEHATLSQGTRLGPQHQHIHRPTIGTLADAGGQGLEVGHIEAAREERETTKRGRANFWDDYRLIHCADGKARRIESGIQPLAHGVSGRVGMLRGYGNAIVPPLAVEFIKAFAEL